jgi:hypothetical protein
LKDHFSEKDKPL